MSTNIAKSVESTIVGARLDYCNSLLHEVPADNLYKPQSVQNALDRVVTGTNNCDRMTTVLKELRFLSINVIIAYKIVIRPYKLNRRDNRIIYQRIFNI